MTENNNIAEIKRRRRLLRESADIAQHASLTGSLAGGASRAVRRYNSVVARLEEIGAATPGMFEPLPDTTTFDELGVESTLLAGYLKEDIDQYERQQSAQAGQGGGGPNNLFITSANSLEGLKDLQELKDLGRMIREGFPEWMKGKATAPDAPESAAAAANTPTAPDVDAPEPAPEPMPEFITGR